MEVLNPSCGTLENLRRGFLPKSDYVNYQDDKNYGCAIRNGSLKGVCKQDDRVDLAKSTRLAIRDFHTAWKDKGLAASGAAVQATIMSHNAGYDASVFGEKKPKYGNMIAAYRRHKKENIRQRIS